MHKSLGFEINRLAKTMKAVFNQQIEEYQLTVPQYIVLKIIYDAAQNDVALTAADIADENCSDRPTITGIVQRLCKMGHVIKVSNPNDKRSSLLELDESIVKVIPKIEAKRMNIQQVMCKGIESEELTIFNEVLNQMNKNVTELKE